MSDVKPTTTFVTIYIDLELDAKELKTNESRFQNFETLASTGIPLCVFISPQHLERLESLIQRYPNVILYKTVEIKDIWISQLVEKENDKEKGTIGLPSTNNPAKDNHAYMILQNSKIEFVKQVADANPFKTSQFAWIDFSIFHVFTYTEQTKQQLSKLSTCKLKHDRLVIPGCHPRIDSLPNILARIQWRFCGGFFMGTANAIQEFFEFYQENLPLFLKTHKKLIWEVNFWAYLESFCYWRPLWYAADHNDSIVSVPQTFLYEQNADIYYLSFEHSERDMRMRARFQQLQINAVRCDGVEGDFTIAHFRMIQRFLQESTKKFCIFMEDDVFISKDLSKRINELTEKMVALDLDILSIGYLITCSPRNCHWLPQIDTMGQYTIHNYHDELWGTQGYILTRAYAMYLVEKYTLNYVELGKQYPNLTCWSPDFLITKKGKRALLSPMLCVEEGNIKGDFSQGDPHGQLALDRKSVV